MEVEYKITGILIHKNTAIVSREPIQPLNGTGGNQNFKRENIVNFSNSARARLAFVVNETEVSFTSFLTLTYPKIFPTDGRQVKKDLNLFLVKARYHFKSIEYLWFLEFQKRGAPHFHLLTNIPPTNYALHIVCKSWAQVLRVDKTRVYNFHKGLYGNRPALEAIHKKDGAKRYALKYALKTYQKTVPKYYENVGRFWGASRNVKGSINSFDDAIIFPDNMSEVQKLEKINKLCGTDFPEFAPKYVFLRKKTLT